MITIFAVCWLPADFHKFNRPHCNRFYLKPPARLSALETRPPPHAIAFSVSARHWLSVWVGKRVPKEVLLELFGAERPEDVVPGARPFLPPATFPPLSNLRSCSLLLLLSIVRLSPAWFHMCYLITPFIEIAT